ILLAAMAAVLAAPADREASAEETRRVWQQVEVVLEADKDYADPYQDVNVWVDLEGPDFRRRCFGFWDGGDVFRVRITATAPGKWQWRSGSNQNDSRLRG
ncbi:unnamed protein product, partial [marine sediment metagenome]